MRKVNRVLGSRIDQMKAIRLVLLLPAATFLRLNREMMLLWHTTGALT